MEQEKSLLTAMAINRWARSVDAQINERVYVSSRDVQAAIQGDGVVIRTEIDIARNGFERVVAVHGSKGFDPDLEITPNGGDSFLVKLKA